MEIVILGVDLGKTDCSVAGLDASGRVVTRRRIRRVKLAQFLVNLPRCVVAMEACCGAHQMGRIAADHGHEVRLMPPEYVRPYVKAQKNDDRDAEGIAEAATRPTMRFVTLKTAEQLDLQSLHRLRERLVNTRTRIINQLRAFLLERGIAVAKKPAKLRAAVPGILANEANGLRPRMRTMIEDMMSEIRDLDERIGRLDREILEIAYADPDAQRLMAIPGIGPLSATAIVAAVGDASAFKSGRDLAAWLGLVPRQVTTGGKPRLLGITKRGNKYIRRLLVHGARSAKSGLLKSETPRGRWLAGVVDRRHGNVATVALAQKMARTVWALLAHGRRYDPAFVPAPPVA